jgi:hypothetical protein
MAKVFAKHKIRDGWVNYVLNSDRFSRNHAKKSHKTHKDTRKFGFMDCLFMVGPHPHYCTIISLDIILYTANETVPHR